MTSILLEDKSIENFKCALLKLQKSANAVIILSCDANNFSKEQLDPILEQVTIPIIGGIFPAIVYDNIQYDTGTILVGLNNSFEVHILENISQEKDYDIIVEKKIGELNHEIKTMFLFFDGISQNIDAIIQAIFDNFGLTINYLGGSAANRNMEKQPILFSQKGLLEDAALIALSTSESTIGVKHGWEPISKTTYQVTRSKGNIIYEIDYRPAFDVYREIIEELTDYDFDEEDYFTISRSFPLGMHRLSGDSIVRVATGVNRENNSLICKGNVPENSTVYILHVQNAKLIEAAKLAASITEECHYEEDFTLYIGCLARLLTLGNDFYKELNAIYKKDERLIGALSVGEIANNQNHYLELYNSTAVVAKIADV